MNVTADREVRVGAGQCVPAAPDALIPSLHVLLDSCIAWAARQVDLDRPELVPCHRARSCDHSLE
jgi:hypothetical protein